MLSVFLEKKKLLFPQTYITQGPSLSTISVVPISEVLMVAMFMLLTGNYKV